MDVSWLIFYTGPIMEWHIYPSQMLLLFLSCENATSVQVHCHNQLPCTDWTISFSPNQIKDYIWLTRTTPISFALLGGPINTDPWVSLCHISVPLIWVNIIPYAQIYKSRRPPHTPTFLVIVTKMPFLKVVEEIETEIGDRRWRWAWKMAVGNAWHAIAALTLKCPGRVGDWNIKQLDCDLKPTINC